MYRGVSGEDNHEDGLSERRLHLGEAVDRLVKALQILDECRLSPAIGARLEAVIDALRDAPEGRSRS